ncbi:MAG: prenyltransferase/squalene oxidase repeat-containing protein [Saprospiraceae bacterium]
MNEISREDWRNRTDAALAWLRRSIEVTGGNGASHSWHPLLGWAKAYPETTGYLIETLLAYAELKQDDSLKNLAFEQRKWLKTIQLPSGAFTGLLVGNHRPSVFNTSQILFGLNRGAASHRAVSWLLSKLESDGAWRSHAYVPGFVPSYYTRAVWGVLQSNSSLQHPDIKGPMRQALQFYAKRFLPNGAVKDWGFRSGEPAFTHTIAYTLEGFWESSLLLAESGIREKVMASLERLLAARKEAGGRTAGRYDEGWNGDHSFLCITGNCQLSSLCHKVWVKTGESKFKESAHSFLTEILDFQRLGANKNTFGAFIGSAPIWGAYLPFRYPNWTVKFFLDAMLLNK